MPPESFPVGRIENWTIALSAEKLSKQYLHASREDLRTAHRLFSELRDTVPRLKVQYRSRSSSMLLYCDDGAESASIFDTRRPPWVKVLRANHLLVF